jgi:hypothetical protein
MGIKKLPEEAQLKTRIQAWLCLPEPPLGKAPGADPDAHVDAAPGSNAAIAARSPIRRGIRARRRLHACVLACLHAARIAEAAPTPVLLLSLFLFSSLVRF